MLSQEAKPFPHFDVYTLRLRFIFGINTLLGINTKMFSPSVAMVGSSSQNRIDVSIERLSTGKRINSVKDDVAGALISTRLTAEIMGINKGIRNAADTQSLLDTAEAGLKEIHSLLLRRKELIVKSANGTLSSSDRSAVYDELNQIKKTIKSISSNTSWGGKKLLDGTFMNKHSLISSRGSYNVGNNNSNDISIVANHPTMSSHPYFIQFSDDTTAGMIRPYTAGGGTDSSLDPSSRIEILGKEYVVPQGTKAAKRANLRSQLAADGIASTEVTVGAPWGSFLEVSESTLSDYISAYGTNSFNFYGDPMDVSDGASNDHDLISGPVSLMHGKGDLKISIEKADYFFGSEFKVNSTPTGNQSYPSVSALSNGGFVVLWESDNDIYAQRYGSNEEREGSEFRVNSYTGSVQSGVEATGLSNGGFVVTWISDGQDGSGQGVFGQIFEESGSTSGSEFRVNTHTINHQTTPKIDYLSDGGFIVTWSSRDQDGSDQGIFGQRYNSSGSTVGAEFQINSHTNRNQSLPSISSLQNGGFVVTWVSDQQEGLGLSDGLYGQIFDSTVNKVGSEFLINTTTSGSQTEPSVVSLNNGGFVVSWHYNTSASGDYNIGAQIFGSSGAKIGSEIQVNTYTTAEQHFPSTASLEDGGFLISWQSKDQDGSDWGVYAQRFDSIGSKAGSEFKVNDSTDSWQLGPRLTTLSNGSVVAAWHSNHDGNEEIYAKVIIRGTDRQIEKVSESRAKIGSLNNRLDIIVSNNLRHSINLKRANGRIKDADFALETAELAKNNILQQTSIQMEVIAKTSGENLTRLLNGDSFVHKKSFLY